jgi:hypothetical protein
MNRVLRAAMVAFALVAALALAACGNEEQNDYVDEVNAVQNAFLDEMTAVAATPPTNASQAGDVVGRMQEAFTTAAEDFEGIDPPDEVAELHDELIATMSDLGDQIGQLQDALQSGNAQQAQQAAVELQSALAEAQTRVTELTDQINAEFEG